MKYRYWVRNKLTVWEMGVTMLFVGTMKFDVMWENEKVGRIEVVDDKVVKAEQNDCPLYARFIPLYCKRVDLPVLADLLKDRCWEEGRVDLKEILDYFGISGYNVFEIVKVTHGTDFDDKMWFRFDGEDLCWDDINPRRPEGV